MRRPFLAAAFVVAASVLPAQGEPVHPASPYAGQHSRDIKSLSEAQIRDLLEGAGMGHAKPAELNSYPGPAHALEQAQRLGLSGEQRDRIRALLDRHKAEARMIGAEVVGLERELDRLFAERKAHAGAIDALTGRIGETLGRLRASHLKAHVETTAILTPSQVHLYDAARGYGSSRDGTGGHHHRHRP
jgi:hypothetical protein